MINSCYQHYQKLCVVIVINVIAINPNYVLILHMKLSLALRANDIDLASMIGPPGSVALYCRALLRVTSTHQSRFTSIVAYDIVIMITHIHAHMMTYL